MSVADIQVDAFTDSAFKGNPAVVCILDGKNERDDSWLQSLAAEFNIPLTCFVIPPITSSHSPHYFLLRWFTPTTEVDLCAHATLASLLTLSSQTFFGFQETESFLIELDFPVIPTCDYNSNDKLMFSKALNGATIVDIRGTTTDKIISKAFNGASKASSTDKIIVVLQTWESVTELQPRMDDILKCPGKIIIVTAAAPPQGSAYDFCSRIFAPKLGVDEDAVCGSAHCALAHYWSLKMNKTDFVAYAVHYDKEKQRVLLTGKAVTVMKGYVLV
ncbi:phenazine biosynthesis PhzC/PhzF family protein [Raphanus sativus]|nr:phenazine biosynthesis PhzC/PhzF family protein [Raphanus sativus]